MDIRERREKILLMILIGLFAPISFADMPTDTLPAASFADVPNTYTPPVQHSTNSILGSKYGSIVVQVGGFNVYQGKSQHVAITELVGDDFTVTKHNDYNFLLGLGYFINGPDDTYINCSHVLFNTMIGINAFYLPKTYVKGEVIQEDLYNNLSYKYSVTNYPVYLTAKALFKTPDDHFNITVDLGAGPNFIQAGGFSEKSIDGGITIPDHIFSTKTNVALSATAGIGVQFNNIIPQVPFECGYRFFYLGEGQFNTATSLTTTLHTGNGYANALMCSVNV